MVWSTLSRLLVCAASTALVVSFAASAQGPAAAAGDEREAARGQGPAATAFRTPLPEATSSFGAVASNGWLYVYGGHVVRTHSYSTESMSGRFHRLALDGGTTWETLPEGPRLQGLNLVAHKGVIYRMGGMEARNAPGERQDLNSVDDVARFDPARGAWDTLPSLPTPRSSYDVVAAGDKLYVMGGWNMGGGSSAVWAETMDILDLSTATPTWTSVPQPFKRRALIATVADNRIYVLGGIDSDDSVQLTVNVFDLRTMTWSEGPALPGTQMNGFSPAACTLDGRVYVSVGDGTLHRLNAAKDGWEQVGTNTPRIVHRMVPDGPRLLILGGAAGGKNLDVVEVATPGT